MGCSHFALGNWAFQIQIIESSRLKKKAKKKRKKKATSGISILGQKWIYNQLKYELYGFQNNIARLYIFYDCMHRCGDKLVAVYIQWWLQTYLILLKIVTLQRLLSEFHGSVANHCQYTVYLVYFRSSLLANGLAP